MSSIDDGSPLQTLLVEETKTIMEVITEGKVKTVYQGDDAQQVIIEYHDKVTAGNGEMVDHPLGKGSLCCSISSVIFEKLSKEHIPTHISIWLVLTR